MIGCRRPAPRGAAIVALLVAAFVVCAPASAVRTRSWRPEAELLARGEADGVAISARGRLFPAPRLARIGGSLPGQPVHVWSSVADRGGTLYLGTGPDGAVLRIGTAGRATVLFRADEPMITALALAGDGSLLAAAAPGGVIYRVGADGSATPWCDTGERYVWTLVADGNGRVWAGTGERGRVLTIDAGGHAETLFDSDEPHIVSLLRRDDGTLLAGGAGRGLVYAIDEDGNALVLHDDELDEVTSMINAGNGSILAALVAAPADDTRPPAFRLRLPDGVEVGAASESVSSFEETEGPLLRGVIEGLPAPRPHDGRLLGRVVRIDADGRATTVWSSSSEAPFSLTVDALGATLFGAGEPARVYRIGDDGDVALLATLREAQATTLQRAGSSVLAATSNPAAAYLLQRDHDEVGVYVSPAFDAGGPARWGSIRWSVEGAAGRVELYTRTGNSAEPDATWSAWSPTLTDPRGSSIVNPEGRFMQWRARFVGPGCDRRLSDVEVSYAPFNREPELRDLRIDREAVADRATLRWSARDPDGDPVQVRLLFRAAGTAAWSVAGADDGQSSEDGAWRDGTLAWPIDAVDEGVYELRAEGSDQPSNHPGEGLTVSWPEPLRLIVDRGPPTLELQRSGDRVEVDVSDRLSDVAALELVRDGRVEASIRPVDGVCDSRRERFVFPTPEREGWNVRARDAAGNEASGDGAVGGAVGDASADRSAHGAAR